MERRTPKITVEFNDDGFALIRMQNNENRLNPEFFAAFNEALDRVEGNKSCRAVITTGEGKFYSNGLDLEYISKDPEVFRKTTTALRSTLTRLLTFPILTIAALNGHTFAGGAFLAICHDLRIMRTERGWISWNEIHLSLTFTDFLMKLVLEKLPLGQIATQAIVLGKRFTAEESLQAGIINAVAAEQYLIPEAKSLAMKYLLKGGFDRTTLKAVKEHVNRAIIEQPEKETMAKL